MLGILLMCLSIHLPSVQVAQDKVKVYLEQQEYIAALRELVLPSNSEKLPGSWESVERDLGSEALRVAALHDHFGHKLVLSTILCSCSQTHDHCGTCMQGRGHESSARGYSPCTTREQHRPTATLSGQSFQNDMYV